MSIETAHATPNYVYTWAGFSAKFHRLLSLIGMGWISQCARLLIGGNRAEQMRELKHSLVIPFLGILVFLLAWAWLAPHVKTSLGVIPGPVQVWAQVGKLADDHQREKEKEVRFYERQQERNAKLIAAGDSDKVKVRKYTGKPTFVDQILTSLITVGLGFIIATLIAVPVGLACGLSRSVQGLSLIHI